MADRRPRAILRLLVFIAIAFLPAMSGLFFRPGAWYAALAKPEWTPPGWVFGPAWTALYFTIGLSGWFAWSASAARQRSLPFAVYGLQLVLNGMWSWLFFGLHRPGLALLDLVALWAAILVTIVLFYRLSRPAAWLLVPYWLWVSFAGLLNGAIYRMNG